MTNVGEFDWVLGTAPKFGLREKKNSKKQPELAELRQTVFLKYLSSDILLFFSINFLFFII